MNVWKKTQNVTSSSEVFIKATNYVQQQLNLVSNYRSLNQQPDLGRIYEHGPILVEVPSLGEGIKASYMEWKIHGSKTLDRLKIFVDLTMIRFKINVMQQPLILKKSSWFKKLETCDSYKIIPEF